ncbi:iron-containing alcohol dehydrogenase, partial [Vibrio parahaemolyticus]|nr:iron-containing alcohol dehydrogenase [Vibrio parahaemolyticus]
KEHGGDFILAVGGGSVIDGSKYVAAASKYDGDGWDIMIGKHQVTEATPLAAILTLPATGSESNMGAVITKKETQDKLPFMSPAVQPKFAVLDPDVMKTLPERQLINGIVDAWVHVCEQYLTLPTGAMVQDGYAETLLKTLKTLGEQFAERDDDMWRANLMWSANQALNGLIGSGVPQDWATHMIGHELTALWGVDHARSLA